MLGSNSEKMVISSSTTTNEWPSQGEESTLMAPNGGNRVMDQKPAQEQQPLKCPRCDSSNTKFCYYNNYSLSQPRHFCKACKRYWTRGGTLRNVPVGGGYRKNKRVKRPASGSDGSSSLTSHSSTPTSQAHHHHIDVSTTSNGINPLFYGLPNTNPSYLNLSSSYPRLFSSRSSDIETSLPPSCNGYDTMGLSYPSLTMTSADPHEDDYGSGFNRGTTSHIQDLITSSNSLLSNFSLFGSSTSNLHQQQKMAVLGGGSKEGTRNSTASYLQGLLPFQNLQMGGNNDDDQMGMGRKEVKMEEAHHSLQNGNKLEWNTTSLPCQNTVIGSSDPSLYWNSMSVGAWPELANYGSSVTSLI